MPLPLPLRGQLPSPTDLRQPPRVARHALGDGLRWLTDVDRPLPDVLQSLHDVVHLLQDALRWLPDIRQLLHDVLQ